MSKSLEVQKLVIQSARSVEYLKQNKIEVYSSVPLFVKMPYIKLAGINTDAVGNGIQRFTIEFFIATNGKNNKKLLEICENLYNEMPNKLNEIIQNNQNDYTITLCDIYSSNFSILEDLRNDCWCGKYVISIDIC